ncbi:hypothetical protein BH11PLA2_BH11PLA2_40440 [soil metagenome]
MVRYIVLLACISSLGCVNCNFHACDASLAPYGPGETIAKADRNRVHVYIINGDDPFGSTSLGKLKAELNASGFAQVNYGGLFYAPWFESKIRRLQFEDPQAKVILIGHGFGVGTADGIAARLSREGIAVETVVALSPRYMPGFNTQPVHDVRRVVIQAKDATGTPLLGGDKAYSIDETGSVVEDAATAGLVLGLVREACDTMPKVETVMTAALPIIDDPAPLPRMKPVTVPTPKEPVKGILTGNQK